MFKLTQIFIGLLLVTNFASAQQTISIEHVSQGLERDGRFAFEKSNILALKFDYTFEGDQVEAIAFRPAATGKYPAVVLIPGFSRTARDYIPMGLRLAKAGFACLAITQRGFGHSAGSPDFVGPKTMVGLRAGFEKFRQESYVDADRMGMFGYSRGALAASLLACQLTDHGLRGAVFASGIYDFKKAHADISIAGIRENMEQEAGLSDEAFAERTSITKMSDLACPVLILHGEKDENAPIGQAYQLAERLKELGKEFELKTYPDRDHNLGRENVNDAMLTFFEKNLKEGKSD